MTAILRLEDNMYDNSIDREVQRKQTKLNYTDQNSQTTLKTYTGPQSRKSRVDK